MVIHKHIYTEIIHYMPPINSLNRCSCDGAGGLWILHPAWIRCTDCYRTLWSKSRVLLNREEPSCNTRMIISTSVQQDKTWPAKLSREWDSWIVYNLQHIFSVNLPISESQDLILKHGCSYALACLYSLVWKSLNQLVEQLVRQYKSQPRPPYCLKKWSVLEC